MTRVSIIHFLQIVVVLGQGSNPKPRGRQIDAYLTELPYPLLQAQQQKVPMLSRLKIRITGLLIIPKPTEPRNVRTLVKQPLKCSNGHVREEENGYNRSVGHCNRLQL